MQAREQVYELGGAWPMGVRAGAVANLRTLSETGTTEVGYLATRYLVRPPQGASPAREGAAADLLSRFRTPRRMALEREESSQGAAAAEAA